MKKSDMLLIRGLTKSYMEQYPKENERFEKNIRVALSGKTKGFSWKCFNEFEERMLFLSKIASEDFL